jgi:predicted RNA-binding protein with PIN domain
MRPCWLADLDASAIKGSMDIIVDGYNLIFRLGWHGRAKNSMALEKARDRLIRELKSRFEPSQRPKITIVFDAKRSPIKQTENSLIVEGFKIVFASNYDEADSLIEEMIGQHSAPKNLTVVSADRKLQETAARRKAKFSSPEAWIDSCDLCSEHDRGSEFEKELGSLENIDWLSEFGRGDPE